MEFTRILCLAFVIGFATSQPAIPLNRAINIYGYVADLNAFKLPPNNRDIRCTQIEEAFRNPRGGQVGLPPQGINEADVINAMRGPLASFLTQAQVDNHHYWVIGGDVTPDYELYNNPQMTLQEFMNLLNLDVPQAGHFLGIRNVRARLQDDISVTVSYHAANIGYPAQHHTISFNIQGI